MSAQTQNTGRPRFVTWLFIFAALLIPHAATAQEAVAIPDEVKRFVGTNRIPIALETGDLNGDGRKDLILVVSDVISEEDRYKEEAGARSVQILVRDDKGSLSLAAQNDLVALCRNCGGAFGDPFEGVVIRGTRFTVMNYGGSAERWSYNYTFNYSRRDRDWQLVRVEESHYNNTAPERTMKTNRYTPPKHYGLIAFSEFDPFKFKGRGKR